MAIVSKAGKRVGLEPGACGLARCWIDHHDICMNTVDLVTLAPRWQPSDEPRLWRKLLRVAARISFADQLVAAWYCAMDSATPQHVRGLLLAALAYFILPVDAVPDIIAGIGFTDDAAVIAAVMGAFARHVTPEHRARAARRLDQLLR